MSPVFYRECIIESLGTFKGYKKTETRTGNIHEGEMIKLRLSTWGNGYDILTVNGNGRYSWSYADDTPRYGPGFYSPGELEPNVFVDFTDMYGGSIRLRYRPPETDKK